MNTALLKQARKLFNSDMVPAHINRANQIKWARALRDLGDKHLLAKPVQRRSS